MMLDPDRKNYCTGSQIHRIMGGFQTELNKPEKPDFYTPELEEFLGICDEPPLVRHAKDNGYQLSGVELRQAWAYYKSLADVFTAGMDSYALEIAMGAFMADGYEPPELRSKHIDRGNLLEQNAMATLSGKTGLDFELTGDDQAFITRWNIGVTPDGGVFGDDFSILAGGEVKCPMPKNHIENILKLHSSDDLLALHPEYYWQCQAALYVTGASVWHFASYSQDFIPSLSLCHVPITRNDEHMAIMADRADRVIRKAHEYKKQIEVIAEGDW